jgi:cytochrome P450
VLTPEVLSRSNVSATIIMEYFSDLIAERRRTPTDDLTSMLIIATETGDQLREDELLITVGSLLGAGLEAMTNLLGAGNRDPERFSEPNRLDLARIDNASLSFGGGIHHCLGAPLAKVQAEIALPALLRRFPKITPCGTPERRDSLTLRGYARLPIQVA